MADPEESDRERTADMSLLHKLGVSIDRNTSSSQSSQSETKQGAASVIVKPLTNKSTEDDGVGIHCFNCICLHRDNNLTMTLCEMTATPSVKY